MALLRLRLQAISWGLSGHYVQGWDIISTGQTSYLRILNEGIRAEYWTGGPDFQKAVVDRFEKIEGIINFDDQEQKV